MRCSPAEGDTRPAMTMNTMMAATLMEANQNSNSA